MSEWRGSPALREMLVPIDRLVPFERNPRVGDVTAVAASLERFGQLKPVVVDGDRIVAGHHVVQAARERLGWEQIAVAANDFGGEDEQRAFLLADNRTAELGFTDQALLAEHLQLLAEQNLLDGTGYDGDDLDDLLADLQRQTDGDRDADAVPSLPAEPSSRRGEVYELGRHRLMCGDCTDSDDVSVLVGEQRFHSVVTDPPYGIDHDGVSNDSPVMLRRLLDAVLACAPLEDAVVAAFQSPRTVPAWLAAIEAAGHRFERLLWLYRGLAAKTFPWRGWVLASDAIVLSSHGTPEWPDPEDHCHDTYVKTELEEAALTGVHTTIKPAWVVRDLVSKLPRGPVYEPFAGSGTTLIAAEQLGRTCFAMEIDPVYCDVIRQRYADFIGQPERAPTA